MNGIQSVQRLQRKICLQLMTSDKDNRTDDGANLQYRSANEPSTKVS